MTTEFDLDELHLYLHRTFATDQGYLAFSYGIKGHMEDGTYKFQEWKTDFHNWPMTTEAIDNLQTWITKLVNYRADIYVCPMLRKDASRVKWNGIGGRTVWADLDGNGAKIPEQLSDVVTLVESGSPGHYHAYIQLTDFVDAQTIERLNRALAKASSADSKWANNTVLRLPGTINFKHGGTPVKTVHEAKYDVNSAELLTALQHYVPDVSEVNATAEEFEAVKTVMVPIHLLTPKIRQLFREEPNEDRSKQSYLFIATCYDAGLSVDLTYTLALHHKPTREKFGGRQDGIKWEVLDVIRKLNAKRTRR